MKESSLKFDKIFYPNSYTFGNRREIQEVKLIGIDSETLTTGEPFMFCTPGREITPGEIPEVFFTDYPGAKFVVYNISFDSGSLLYHLPERALNFLRVAGVVVHNHIKYEYIENKQLRMTKGSVSVVFWDVYQYYNSSLDKAADTYLGNRKIDLGSKKFTVERVRENRENIAAYCKQDARLTEELGYLVLETFQGWGIPVNSLISTAYISELHFTKTCNPYILGPDAETLRDPLRLAFESYSGGIFACWKRGRGYFYMYDICSAYPEAIANLVDLRDAKFVADPSYLEGATYAWYRCEVDIEEDIFHPLAIRQQNINFYPVGSFNKVMTKPEYEYLHFEKEVDIRILEGWHCYCKRNSRKPFYEEINRLYDLKEEMKLRGEKGMRYAGVKILMNSFYGKFMQLTPVLPDDLLQQLADGTLTEEQILNDAERAKLIRYKAGRLWNPFYSSYITALVRLKVLRICNQIPDHAVAVATDSIISTVPLEKYLTIGSGLGEWSKEEEGQGLVIGSGVYQVAGLKKFRGFTSRTDFINYEGDRTKQQIGIEAERPYSWREVVFRGLPKDYVNRFHFETRNLDINFETRRSWDRPWTSIEDMLTEDLQDSGPLVYMDLPDAKIDRRREEREYKKLVKEDRKQFRKLIMDLGGIKPRGDYEEIPAWCIRKNGIRLDLMVMEVSYAGYFVTSANKLLDLLWSYT